MSKRISHSLLDPLIFPYVQPLYRILPIPRSFPPEGIIFLGHVVAIAGAVGMALSANYWWGGILAAIGVFGNHIADMVDGTHARNTGQCRNGGELLDHFTDPLSFSYWVIGISLCCQRLEFGLIAVLCIYATAVLTNIKAKITGEFTLAKFGSTEFKALLFVFGLLMATLVGPFSKIIEPVAFASGFLLILITVGLIQLVTNLILAVREVNISETPPDTTNWQLRNGKESP